jgi:MFS family permease
VQPAVSDTARRWITAALLIGTFLASIEVMVVGPAMPAVVTEFGGAGLYPFVFTTYIGAQTLTMPLYGLMADRWGRRDAFLLGVTLFLIGSLISAAAPSMAVVVAGRLVQGLGAGAILPLTMTIFGDLYPVAARTRMQGWFSLIWGVSSLVGPAVGGALTEALSWRAVFWLNLPPGLIAAALIAVLLPRRLGATTERRTGLLKSLPILLRDPTLQAVSLSGFALGIALFGVVGYLPVRVQAVEGGTALDAGLALIPMSVAWTISANVAGRLVDQTGFRTLVRIGAALTAVGTVIAGVWTANLFGLVLFGAGMGLLISSFTVASQVAAPPGLIGQATSLGLFTRSVGGALGLPALGLLAGMSPGVSDFAGIPDLPGGLQDVFLAVAVSGVIAALIVAVRFPGQATSVTSADSTPESTPDP